MMKFNWTMYAAASSKEAAVITEKNKNYNYTNTNPANADLIIERCKMMHRFANFAEDISRKEWLLGISVLNRCQNGEELIHYYSEMDASRYKSREVSRMYKDAMKNGVGATLCNTFKLENENICKDCVFQGLINSPISLGYVRFNMKTVIELPREVFEQRLYISPILQDFYHNKVLTFVNENFEHPNTNDNVVDLTFNVSSGEDAMDIRLNQLFKIFREANNDGVV